MNAGGRDCVAPGSPTGAKRRAARGSKREAHLPQSPAIRRSWWAYYDATRGTPCRQDYVQLAGKSVRPCGVADRRVATLRRIDEGARGLRASVVIGERRAHYPSYAQCDGSRGWQLAERVEAARARAADRVPSERCWARIVVVYDAQRGTSVPGGLAWRARGGSGGDGRGSCSLSGL